MQNRDRGRAGRITLTVMLLTAWLAVTVAGTLRFIRSRRNVLPTVDSFSQISDPVENTNPAVPVVLGYIPEEARAVKGAQLPDYIGQWSGEFHFRKFEGFENMPDLPDGYAEMVERMLAEASPVSLEIEDDGEWSLYIDCEMGVRMSSGDLRDNPDAYREDEEIPELSQDSTEPEITFITGDGYYIYVEMSDSGRKGHVLHQGTLCEDNESRLIAGEFEVALTMQGADVIMGGDFVVRPAGEE